MKRKGFILFLLAVCLLTWLSYALADGTWICPSCGRENPDRANFCGSCREPKPSNEISANVMTNAWVCPNCGEICSDEDTFCMMCGQNHTDLDERALLIPQADMPEMSLTPVNILQYPYTFNTKEEELTLEYYPPVSGDYRFFIQDAKSGLEVFISVFDNLGDQLKYTYAKNGEGLTIELKGGERHTVKLLQNRDLGSFTLRIGEPRSMTELKSFRLINDSISFREQNNRYILRPEISGYYRFDLLQAQSGFEVFISVYDSLGYQQNYTYANQGEGVGVELTAGETYYINVVQNRDIGNYQLRVGCPKKTVDISGITYIGDDLFFREQQNKYLLTPAEDGDYLFQITKADSKTEVFLAVYDQGGYQLNYGYLNQGEGVQFKLDAGSIYTVMVQQNNGTGPYSLKVIH